MNKQFHLTKDGIEELNAEIKQLMSRRVEIAEAINIARQQGDLSENAEYTAAKSDQERTEKRIAEIDHILKNVAVIKQRKSDKVVLGSVVELKNAEGKATFTVVGTVEADPLSGKVSDVSPIGSALLGKSVGDDVEIVLPSKTKKYKVASIS
ncbi:transcription elongation factor GreA [Candidatus Saccharibacteria bacterium]|nr:transcription elongation factor GreA [Candidatus Saccharibacteria bacterium]MCB9821334.1 transcription elongation factor GreA [Candidatus Nomurabacteria bacterium]